MQQEQYIAIREALVKLSATDEALRDTINGVFERVKALQLVVAESNISHDERITALEITNSNQEAIKKSINERRQKNDYLRGWITLVCGVLGAIGVLDIFRHGILWLLTLHN